MREPIKSGVGWARANFADHVALTAVRWGEGVSVTFSTGEGPLDDYVQYPEASVTDLREFAQALLKAFPETPKTETFRIVVDNGGDSWVKVDDEDRYVLSNFDTRNSFEASIEEAHKYPDVGLTFWGIQEAYGVSSVKVIEA